MRADLLDKIRSRGYWRINFRPIVEREPLGSLSACKEIVEKSAVLLRGWDYPHFPRRLGEDSGLGPAENYYEGWVDWWNHKEFWRMYETTQFLHYLALREDWLEEDGWDASLAKTIRPGTSLGIIGSVIYQMSEIHEFLARLTGAGIYDDGVRVAISLNNTKDRQLWIEDVSRAPFHHEYRTVADRLEYKKEYSKAQVMDTSRELALKAVLFMFDHFGWERPSVEIIARDQENLFKGRF